jgi:hypothetical protein
MDWRELIHAIPGVPEAEIHPQNPQNGQSQGGFGDIEDTSTAYRNAREAPRQACAEPKDGDTGRATWTRSGVPAARRPLIPPAVRSKIEAIESDARAKGWPAELLWNAGFWDTPRGLAALLDPVDEIAEVTADAITILKPRSAVVRFRRCDG